jgi:hypothetical protein
MYDNLGKFVVSLGGLRPRLLLKLFGLFHRLGGCDLLLPSFRLLSERLGVIDNEDEKGRGLIDDDDGKM